MIYRSRTQNATQPKSKLGSAVKKSALCYMYCLNCENTSTCVLKTVLKAKYTN